VRNPFRVSAYFALGFMFAAVACKGAQVSQQPLRTLHFAREAHSLPYDQAIRAYPVHLRAVVTYYDPFIDSRHGAVFVHDSSGAIFVRIPPRPILPLRPGTLVDVVGISGPGDYAPIVDQATLQIVGQSHLPQSAPRVTVEQLLSGPMEGQWAEVEGIVHAVHIEPKNVTLDVETTGGPVSATTLREMGVDYKSLIDALVRIRGNAGPVFNQRRQMVGTRLFFPAIGEVKVMQKASGDPFATPILSLARLLSFMPGQQMAHRVHVQGTVTLLWPGSTLCIQSGVDGLCMQTAQETQARIGDLVDVIGFPAISAYKPTLEDASFLLSGSGAPPPLPGLTTSGQALHGNNDGQLVRLDGELIGQDLAAGNPTLMLHSGEFILSAILPKDAVGPGMLPWKVGSILRLTGICSVQFDSINTNLGEGAVRPGSVHVLLRNAGDVAVLRTPSWWTPQHALSAFAIVGILVIAAMTWIMVLRHQVEQRTVALRDSRERLRHLSEHDALTNLPNRILLNDRLHMAIARARRFEACLGLLLVDVDRFKEVNDALGHQAGDGLLCELARRMCDSVRSTDTVARIGGDEFIVLLPDLRIPAEAETIAAKILAAVSTPFRFGTECADITVSVGVATFPDGGTDIDGLVKCADAAMYLAKAGGRNGYKVYARDVARAGETAPSPRLGPQVPQASYR
jgi:diguanylate cyclase (GGDEF)-like protein